MRKFMYFFAGLLVIACESEETTPIVAEPQNCTILEVSGTINEPTVWRAGNVYVIKENLSVRSVLTIEPGVTVKVKDASIDVVGGKIIANGTPQKRIVFTSIADDRYCGDTNGDGIATTAAKGDWQQISLNGTTETVFKYVDIFYAGKNRGGNSNAVRISGSNSTSFTFDNCRIAHTLYQNSSYDSSSAFYGSSSMKDASVSQFTNNALYDNGKPIYMSSFYNLDVSNVFHNPEVPSQANTYNGIYLSFTGSASGTTVNWDITEVPYVLDESCHVFDPATITIGAQVVVKFKRASSGFSRGTATNLIIHPSAFLTSYKDDAHGGDTNGDGNSTSPAVGDWEGVYNSYNQSYDQAPNILFSAN